MSSCCGWWEQASIMSTLSPGLRFPNSGGPGGEERQISLENGPSGSRSSKGRTAASPAPRGTCESQTTRAGSSFRQAKAAPSSPSVTTRHNLRPSRASRMVCTCGKMSRPFGAPESMGTTRMTTPFSGSRDPPLAVLREAIRQATARLQFAADRFEAFARFRGSAHRGGPSWHRVGDPWKQRTTPFCS